MKILVINGPNLNMLGIREKALYGDKSYSALIKLIKEKAKEKGVKVKCYQSNFEGAIVTQIQKAYKKFDGIQETALAGYNAGHGNVSKWLADEEKSKDGLTLDEIPYGETKSYKQIAEAIGNPKAVRAVGMANNRNPLLIVIPCHRVIGANGKLVGYAAGIEMKEYLLKLEKSLL